MCAFSVSPPFVGPACVCNPRSLGTTVQRLGSIRRDSSLDSCVLCAYNWVYTCLCVCVYIYVCLYARRTARYSMASLFHEGGRTSLFDPGTIVPPESKSPLCQVVNCFIHVRGCTWNVSSRNLVRNDDHFCWLPRFFRTLAWPLVIRDAFLRVKTNDIEININEDVARRWIQDVWSKVFIEASLKINEKFLM